MKMRVLDATGNEVDARAVDWHSDRTPNFTVRQDSGDGNALGNVRIDMPNPHSVYMHDTNHKEFFSADYRFQSSGCTRVEDVRDFAAWILKDNAGWGRKEIDAEIATAKRTTVQARARHSGGVDLPDRLGEPGRHDPFPQRRLQSRSEAREPVHGRGGAAGEGVVRRAPRASCCSRTTRRR